MSSQVYFVYIQFLRGSQTFRYHIILAQVVSDKNSFKLGMREEGLLSRSPQWLLLRAEK